MKRFTFARTALIAAFGLLVGGIVVGGVNSSMNGGRSSWNLHFPPLHRQRLSGSIAYRNPNPPTAPSTVQEEQLPESGETRPAGDPR
jgi:hypothetical protein